MKNILKILSGCLVVFVLFAPSARADETNLTAVQAWSALTNFSLPTPPMEWQTNPPTEEQLGKFDDLQAAQAGILADQAVSFYTKFPDDANVSRARTTEIQALQMAVHFGATNRLADLNLRETAMIADTNAPEELRYELRIDQVGRELQAASAAGVDRNVEMEKAGTRAGDGIPQRPTGYEML